MIEPGGVAPYAPWSAIMRVLTAKRRNPTLTRFGPQELSDLGIRESLVARTLQALKLLELVDEQDVATEAFEGLATPSRADFSSKLGALLRRVYAPIFAQVDPTRASQEEVTEAFMHFGPPSQRDRMVTLFTYLLREARMTPSGGPPGLTIEASAQVEGAGEKQARIRSKELEEAMEAEASRRRPRPSWASMVSTPSPGSPSRHRLQLASGGSIDIGLNVDLFSLSKEDRDFVMDLVDRVTNYKPKRIEGNQMR
ncbi:DUF5343 domain-containing protein [Curtobacterium sp. SAFR-003]|uniref:DUF5343 domain-containing protein n=1 Tax=Curtobacterium sp. SAFR-003 TaxID=3387276 RepID=UPI003F7E4BF0